MTDAERQPFQEAWLWKNGQKGHKWPDLNRCSDDLVCGTWLSSKGACRIFRDCLTNQLSYEEEMPGCGGRLHGFLERCDLRPVAVEALRWQVEVAFLNEDEWPWYDPTSGEKPVIEGEVRITMRMGEKHTLESRIRFADDEENAWSEPLKFWRKAKQAASAAEKQPSSEAMRKDGVQPRPPPLPSLIVAAS